MNKYKFSAGFNFPSTINGHKRILFRFDDDEPNQIGIIEKDQEFSMSIRDNGLIIFESNGKTLIIYLEDV